MEVELHAAGSCSNESTSRSCEVTDFAVAPRNTALFDGDLRRLENGGSEVEELTLENCEDDSSCSCNEGSNNVLTPSEAVVVRCEPNDDCLMKLKNSVNCELHTHTVPPTAALQQTDKYGFLKNSSLSNVDSQELQWNNRVLSVDVMRKRELKWLDMFNNWPLFMDKRFDKVRNRCRKGIPPSLRPRAWQYLCGANYMSDAAVNFHDLDAVSCNDVWADDIRKDLHRQFPTHELFSQSAYGRFGQEDLFRLLKAWVILHPNEGYCQGQAPIAATLLMHMPVSEAFFCFRRICEKYLPNYFSPGLEAIQLDGAILNGLLKKFSPASYRHLKKQSVEPVLYMVEWFMCIYCRTLPWATVLRVWDMFFCEGVKVIFKVAIVLIRYTLSTAHDLKSCPSLYETVERLRNIPQQVTQEDVLIRKVVELNLSEDDLEKMHYQRAKQRHAQLKQQL